MPEDVLVRSGERALTGEKGRYGKKSWKGFIDKRSGGQRSRLAKYSRRRNSHRKGGKLKSGTEEKREPERGEEYPKCAGPRPT